MQTIFKLIYLLSFVFVAKNMQLYVMKELQPHIQKVVIDAKKRLNMSSGDLSKLCNVSKRTIDGAAKGENISLISARKICNSTGYNINISIKIESSK